jgi:mRNA-degrading endonuclease HigB of HigAB toxin-antitoxin module
LTQITLTQRSAAEQLGLTERQVRRLQELRFVASESAFDYFASTRAYLERYGKPVAFYSDKAIIFHVSGSQTRQTAGITQFSRALSELNIDIVCANSPQAKGRVERAHLTLQDRLVKELRLREISMPEAGNAYLPEFQADYNGRFGREPAT